jgi:hypothetical protein
VTSMSLNDFTDYKWGVFTLDLGSMAFGGFGAFDTRQQSSFQSNAAFLVMGDPGLYSNLGTAGRNDVTSNPSTYSLYTTTELSEAEAAARFLGQADVTSNPSSYNLYAEEYFQSGDAMKQAVEMGRSEVLSSPASFDLYTESDVSVATSAARTIVNVSARVALGEGEIVTPGFVVLGEQKKMLIRAVGPKLADLGVG